MPLRQAVQLRLSVPPHFPSYEPEGWVDIPASQDINALAAQWKAQYAGTWPPTGDMNQQLTQIEAAKTAFVLWLSQSPRSFNVYSKTTLNVTV